TQKICKKSVMLNDASYPPKTSGGLKIYACRDNIPHTSGQGVRQVFLASALMKSLSSRHPAKSVASSFRIQRLMTPRETSVSASALMSRMPVSDRASGRDKWGQSPLSDAV